MASHECERGLAREPEGVASPGSRWLGALTSGTGDETRSRGVQTPRSPVHSDARVVQTTRDPVSFALSGGLDHPGSSSLALSGGLDHLGSSSFAPGVVQTTRGRRSLRASGGPDHPSSSFFAPAGRPDHPRARTNWIPPRWIPSGSPGPTPMSPSAEPLGSRASPRSHSCEAICGSQHASRTPYARLMVTVKGPLAAGREREADEGSRPGPDGRAGARLEQNKQGARQEENKDV